MRVPFTALWYAATLGLSIISGSAGAEPIKLKFAFFTSDRSYIYEAAVRPFVDAVNAEADGLIEIEVFAGGALGKNPVEERQRLIDGIADIALVVPGLTPEKFPDNGIMELPGLFKSMREANLIYTKLVQSNQLRGYEDFILIGAFVTEGESIHTRSAVSSLSDLAGKRIRANNPIKASALKRLGMEPVIMPISTVSQAIGAGEIEGAAVPPAPLFEFGIGRIASNHFLLTVGGAPLPVLMNRKKFESLPPRARAIIEKYSGQWAADRFVERFEAINTGLMEQLRADAERRVIIPSENDVAASQKSFERMVTEWEAESEGHRTLVESVRNELKKAGGH